MARRVTRMLAVVLALVALLGLAGCVDLPSAPTASPADVLVIVCPTLGWTEVTSGEMPTTRSLAERGAAGLIVSRSPEKAARRLDMYAVTEGSRDIGSTRAEGTPAEVDLRVAEAVGQANPGTTIVVVAPPTAVRPGFTVIAGSGYGPGLLSSRSTRRRGLIIDADVEMTVERIAGVRPADPTPRAALGVVATGGTPAERLSGLVKLETFLVAMDRVRYPLMTGYTILVLILVIGGWRVAETLQDRPSFAYTSRVLRRALLFALALPAGGTLLFVIERLPQSPARIVTQLLAATALIWLFAQFAWHKWGTSAAVAFTGLMTAAVLTVDQLLGAPLSLSALVGYSPLGAFRFYGLGNEGAAMLIGSALMGVAMELDAAGAGRAAIRRAAVVTGIVTVGIAALPLFGANVFVAVWGVITFAVFCVRAGGGRFGWRQALTALGVAALVVAAAVMLDRLTGTGTHIARAIGDSGNGGLLAIALRRARTQLAILSASPLPGIALVVLAGFAYLSAHPRGVMARTLQAHPLLRAALTAGFVGGAVGTIVEDSGPVIIALLMLYLAGALAMLMLEPLGEQPEGRALP